MVAVLTLAYTVSFVDRLVISLLVDPIKSDLHLTDTRLALLQGLAFSVFYSTMGLPFGWLADRMSRKWLVVAGSTAWCLATAACGLATSFHALFVARLGVGAGEATLSPSAVSMIGDSFSGEDRPLALGLFAGAASIGSGFALLFGGAIMAAVSASPIMDLPLVGPVRSWQATFVIVGLAGLIVPVLMALLREPPRHRPIPHGTSHSESLLACLAAHRRFFLCHYSAVALYGAIAFGLLAWLPAFFIRRFAWTAAESGLKLGIVLMVAGVLGSLVGGVLAAMARRRGIITANIDAAIPAILLVAPLAAAGFSSSNPALALALIGAAWALYSLPVGLLVGAIQDVAPPHLRGQTAALYYLVIGVIGVTLGPLVVALLTDHVFRRPEAVGTSLAILAAILAPSAAFLLAIGRRGFRLALAQQSAATG